MTAEIFGKRPEARRGDVAVFLLILLPPAGPALTCRRPW
ncbi:Hypothetical protein AA314_00857 [Archangium gephyra]|uniref:Uncharacterized protein n=1 Tax=Archangium gephyra TaxID=48 RepID=A0AAC8Q1N9_9BACT|nr:Hypothetical protein AA314_00857 [Archangium gephyra]